MDNLPASFCSEYFSAIALRAVLIIFELNPPHNPLSEVTTTSKTFLISRSFAKSTLKSPEEPETIFESISFSLLE